MSILSSASVSKSVSSAGVDYNDYLAAGYSVISMNIYPANKDAGEDMSGSTYLTTEHGALRYSTKTSSVFYSGLLTPFSVWNGQGWTEPTSVRKSEAGMVAGPTSKPSALVGLYHMAVREMISAAVDEAKITGDVEALDLAEAAKAKLDINFMVNQKVSFDITGLGMKQLVDKRNQLLKSGQRTRMAMAVKVELPQDGSEFKPCVRVVEVITMDEEYIPLPRAGMMNVNTDMMNSIQAQIDAEWTPEVLRQAGMKQMQSAAIDLLIGGGTTRTKSGNAYRKQKAAALRPAVSTSVEATEVSVVASELSILEGLDDLI